jgi:hypothetical protein
MFGRVRFQPLGLCGGVIGPPADFLITLRRNDSELPTARIDLFPHRAVESLQWFIQCPQTSVPLSSVAAAAQGNLVKVGTDHRSNLE